MKSIQDYSFIFGTVIFTVYAQLIIKWQVAQAGALPNPLPGRLLFLGRLMLNPWVLSGMTAGVVAMLCWFSAMTKFELSYAYPFMSLAFVFVLVLSALMFHERVTS